MMNHPLLLIALRFAAASGLIWQGAYALRFVIVSVIKEFLNV